MGQNLTGGCLCGGVRYSVPVDAVQFGFASCHCSLCRRAHGAPIVMWTGVTAKEAPSFQVASTSMASLSAYQSTPSCTRFFCSACGTHTHLSYDASGGPWANEVHLATATLDDDCLQSLEEHIAKLGKPRALHVFFSDRARCIGDFSGWATSPKFGGVSGMEPQKE